jgi:hypothetical protein
MSTSRWNLLPFRMFRGLPAAAHEVTGSPVMGFVGALHDAGGGFRILEIGLLVMGAGLEFV